MNKTCVILVLVAVGFVAASCFIPAFPIERRHATHLQSVNHLATASAPLGTNRAVGETSRTP